MQEDWKSWVPKSAHRLIEYNLKLGWQIVPRGKGTAGLPYSYIWVYKTDREYKERALTISRSRKSVVSGFDNEDGIIVLLQPPVNRPPHLQKAHEAWLRMIAAESNQESP